MDLIRERLRARGQHRPGMGGDSEMAGDSFAPVDRRVSGRDGAQVSGDANTVNITGADYGAVTAGVEIARGSLASVDASNKVVAATTLAAFAAMEDAQKRSFDLAEDTYSAALDSSKGAFSKAVDSIGTAFETAKAGDQRVVSMVGIAAVVMVAAAFAFSFGKR